MTQQKQNEFIIQVAGMLEECRLRLRRELPYLYPVAVQLRLRVQNLPFHTMGVDERWTLYVDPQMLQQNSERQFIVFVHEVLHAAAQHGERMKQYPANVANIAADLAVNSILREVGGEKWEKEMRAFGMLLPVNYGLPWGLTAEEYAEEIMRRMQSASSPASSSSSSASSSASSSSSSSASSSAPSQRKSDDGGAGEKLKEAVEKAQNEGSGVTGRKAEWEQEEDDRIITEEFRREVLRQVADAAKTVGNLPGELQIVVDRALEPAKVDWRQILRDKLTRARSKPSVLRKDFHRAKRAFIDENIILPTDRLHSPSRSCVIIDTSGSMSERELAAVLSEVRAILEVRKRVSVVCADTCLKGEPKEVGSVDEIELIGGGGTDMVAAIKEVLQWGQFDEVVVLTDGWCDWAGVEDVDVRLIVVVVGDKEVDIPPPAVVININVD